MADKVKIGIIGCGGICSGYADRLVHSEIVEIAACADIIPEKAIQMAETFGIPKSCTVRELLEDPGIEIVLNLTTPDAHLEINTAALNAGKHVYTEKPVALTLEETESVFELAKGKGLRVGCAPETILGRQIRTAKKAIEDDVAGKITAGAISLATPMFRFELWYPEPGHLFQPGGGPLWDTGVYYFTALVYLLGNVKRVTAFAHRSSDKRTVVSQPNCGKTIDVTIDTHYSGALEFESGAIISLTATSDAWHAHMPKFELYGENGTLVIPDPISYEGNVKFINKEDVIDSLDDLVFFERVMKLESPEMDELYRVIEPAGSTPASYGIGIETMAEALREGNDYPVNEKLGYHVLEIMSSIDKAAREGMVVELKSKAL